MFQFLSDWWQRLRGQNRRIFTFRAGGRKRYLDPLVVSSRLDQEEPAWESLLAKLSTAPPAQLDDTMKAVAEQGRREAGTRLAEVGRKAFSLPPIDDRGNGVTEAEVIEVLGLYLMFCWGLAKAAGGFTQAGEPVATSVS